jgi:ABC-2 type transport system ATP-binding protein
METVIDARGLGKRYRSRWALSDCTLSIPAGRVVGLVGPNGAGKTTLLGLAAGLVQPTAGHIDVLGRPPAADRAQLGRVGFVAQDPPIYPGMSIADHLRLGTRLNFGWDSAYARTRLADLEIDVRQRAGRLSGGQRAQLALTLALAKRPELLLLDEPVASLDPLARHDFLRHLADTVTHRGTSVVLSSHLVSDLARTCDYLIVLRAARLVAAGPIHELLAAAASTDLEQLVLGYLSDVRRTETGDRT